MDNTGGLTQIDFEEINKARNNPDVLVIDVREMSELREVGYISGSVNIPLGELCVAFGPETSAEDFKKKYSVAKPSKDFSIIFTCRSGRRSGIAQQQVVNLGYTNYNVYMKAMYGAIQGDFSGFNDAWSVMEKYMIPETQYNVDKYKPSAPADTDGVTVGQDPLGDEMKSTYGDNKLRAMHWLLDVDNIYGFGNIQGECELGPTASGPSFVNNGPGTLWQGVTYPTCDNYKYGSDKGFSFYASVPNWMYSNAPDADARAIQAAYWASTWAQKAGKLSSITSTLNKAGQLGDYLRYCFFDKHFKKIGNCIGGSQCSPGTGKDSAHYLISWYIGWGGSIASDQGYSWRQSSGEAHSGYQNLITAYALLNDANMKPKGATAMEDWKNSLSRQLEFYKWVQTSDGPFGGGVTNSWNENYDEPPSAAKDNTFHGMWYKPQPGYDGSNNWFGMQSWSADRLAQYYYLTGDATAEAVIAKWIKWVMQQSSISGDQIKVPVSLSWNGNTPTDAKASVSYAGNMVGIVSSIARTFSYYAAKSGDTDSKDMAKKLLDALWENNRDDIGLAVEDTVSSLNQVTTKVNVPSSDWTGTYPNGDKINASATFLDIRSWYKKDKNWSQLEAYLNGGSAPKMSYHRYWENADVALAMGAYGLLFDE